MISGFERDRWVLLAEVGRISRSIALTSAALYSVPTRLWMVTTRMLSSRMR